MNGMDKRFEGHTSSDTITSNIHNNQGFTFRKSLYVGQLVCNNQNCDFLVRSSKRDETECQAQPTLHSNMGTYLLLILP